MCEGRRPDIGKVWVEREVHDFSNVVGNRRETIETVLWDRLDSHLEGQIRDHGTEIRVPRSFAVAIDATLYLVYPRLDRGQGVAHCHA